MGSTTENMRALKPRTHELGASHQISPDGKCVRNQPALKTREMLGTYSLLCSSFAEVAVATPYSYHFIERARQSTPSGDLAAICHLRATGAARDEL